MGGGSDGRGRGGLVAFLGPSLSADEARAIVPDVSSCRPSARAISPRRCATWRPVPSSSSTASSRRALSVWHKEVLHAIDLGVRVLGASSMGALRAAELDRFGMEGVGEIYAYYRDGWLTADADVALLHGAAEDDYRPLSWPMVNVRATVGALAADGASRPRRRPTCCSGSRRRCTSAGVPARCWRAALAVAGHGRRDMPESWRPLVEERYVDQKAADASRGSRCWRAWTTCPRRAGTSPRHLGGRGFDTLLYSDVTLPRRPGRCAATSWSTTSRCTTRTSRPCAPRGRPAPGRAPRGRPGPPADRRRAGRRPGPSPRPQLGRRRATARRSGWRTYDLDEERLAGLVLHQALHARMRRWMLDGVALERNRRMVIEQLQIEGRYAAAADAAARRRRWADARPGPPHPSTVSGGGRPGRLPAGRQPAGLQTCR